MTGLALFCAAGNLRAGETDEFLAICYHDVPLASAATNDPYAVDQESMVRQIEYLRTHDYHFISLKDVQAAIRKEHPLPPRAVLMTFDDAYLSFYSNVMPVLQLYQCPAVLSVVSSWIDGTPPQDLPGPLMTWAQVRTASLHPMVTVASHSHSLHQAIPYNPQGNTGHAATSRRYDATAARYETDKEYRQRIIADMKETMDIFSEKAGFRPEWIVWPYGQYNALTLAAARDAGFEGSLGLSGDRASIEHGWPLDRWMVMGNPPIEDFISEVRARTWPRKPEVPQQRAVQVDLDMIYDPSPEQTEKNLGRLLDRMVALRPNMVYVQAFADPDGDGNVSEVYFPNRVLPMRMDLLNRVCNQLWNRQFTVYAWMPVLSVQLPDGAAEHLRVRERTSGTNTAASSSWYERLSPFCDESMDVMRRLYEDLAIHVRFHGVLFQDDAYLTDREDFHPSAVAAARKAFGANPADDRLTPAHEHAWVRLKQQQLTRFTQGLLDAVHVYRPAARSARTLYARSLLDPASEAWFAQNYADCLSNYDFTVILAYPEMEGIGLWRTSGWLEQLVHRAMSYPDALDRTVFKLQAYDWKRKSPIPADRLLDRVRVLVAAGARHVAYYPDDYTRDQPSLHIIRKEMSTESLLFPKPTLRPVTQQY